MIFGIIDHPPHSWVELPIRVSLRDVVGCHAMCDRIAVSPIQIIGGDVAAVSSEATNDEGGD
jgi:hypothetical protein